MIFAFENETRGRRLGGDGWFAMGCSKRTHVLVQWSLHCFWRKKPMTYDMTDGCELAVSWVGGVFNRKLILWSKYQNESLYFET